MHWVCAALDTLAVRSLRPLLCSLKGHFIKYTLLAMPCTLFPPHYCLLWHRLHMCYFGPYWHDDICQLHIRNVNLLHTELRWLWGQMSSANSWSCARESSLRWFEFCDMVHYPVGSSCKKMRVHRGRKWMNVTPHAHTHTHTNIFVDATHPKLDGHTHTHTHFRKQPGLLT